MTLSPKSKASAVSSSKRSQLLNPDILFQTQETESKLNPNKNLHSSYFPFSHLPLIPSMKQSKKQPFDVSLSLSSRVRNNNEKFYVCVNEDYQQT